MTTIDYNVAEYWGCGSSPRRGCTINLDAEVGSGNNTFTPLGREKTIRTSWRTPALPHFRAG